MTLYLSVKNQIALMEFEYNDKKQSFEMPIEFLTFQDMEDFADDFGEICGKHFRPDKKLKDFFKTRTVDVLRGCNSNLIESKVPFPKGTSSIKIVENSVNIVLYGENEQLYCVPLKYFNEQIFDSFIDSFHKDQMGSIFQFPAELRSKIFGKQGLWRNEIYFDMIRTKDSMNNKKKSFISFEMNCFWIYLNYFYLGKIFMLKEFNLEVFKKCFEEFEYHVGFPLKFPEIHNQFNENGVWKLHVPALRFMIQK